MSDPESPTRAPDELVAACEQAGVRLVRFLYCDNGGIVRGKVVPVDRLAARVERGIGLTVAMQAMSSVDQLQPVDGMGPVGEVRLVPDPATFTVLPYASRSAAMLVDMVALDRVRYDACPRTFLTRMCEQLGEHGLVFRCSVENEFSLARAVDDGYVPIDDSLCFSTIGMAAADEVVDAMVDAFERQRLGLDQYYPELGHGQHELSVAHRPAVEAADTQLLVRETIRGVATRCGLVASLAPKPWPDQAGNGAHVHFSMWELTGKGDLAGKGVLTGQGDGATGANAFSDGDGPFGLSLLAEHCVAGILHHLPGLLALTAPSVNSYQRLLPEHWSSAYACWGPDNREAAVRVPSTFWGAEAASTNLEYKPADASANPYLAFGGLIAAALDGIERGLEPPPAVLVDPATLTEAERAEIGAARYPTSLGEALDHLEQDAVLTDALGPCLADSYLAVRRSEAEAFAGLDDTAVCAAHFHKY